MRRRFNRGERIALFVAAGGRCAICGDVLRARWHGDHKRAFSAGGETSVGNGQALCPRCNLRKGARVAMAEGFVPRPHQERRMQALADKIATGGRLFVGDIFPGSGKTKAYLAGLNELWRGGVIDAAVVLVPRRNLAGQVETDWEELRHQLDGPIMGTIRHRENDPPMLRPELGGERPFGYVTTYDSVLSALRSERPENRELHRALFRSRRVGLVLDEAQQLGLDDEGGTQSAQEVEELASMAAFVSIETGTPYRPDGKPIVLADYGDPDDAGTRKLLWDVRATYQEGVEFGYLRPFEFRLGDGKGWREYADGATEELVLSAMRHGMRDVIEHPGYWEPMVDMFVEEVRAVQSINPAFCGLIGATRQPHAHKIVAYLRERHRGFRGLLAVHDERQAIPNLRAFRGGGYDALVTVAMAHVGYDHKPIMVVCMLNDFRQVGWVTQFVGRGLRMMPGVDRDKQVLRGICPPDRRAVKIFEWLRNESELGLKERRRREGPGPTQPRLSVTQDADLTDWSVFGRRESHDLSPGEYRVLDPIVRETPGLAAAPIGSLGHLARRLGLSLAPGPEAPPPAATAAAPKPQMTDLDWEKLERKRLHQRCARYDSRLIEAGVIAKADRGYTEAALVRALGTRVGDGGRPGVARRDAWLDEEWEPFVARAERNAYGRDAHF